jgi:hypothetical protein
MSSEQRESRKHTIRRLKTEIYEYESELATLGLDVRKDKADEEARRQTVMQLVLNLRRKLVEAEESKSDK